MRDIIILGMGTTGLCLLRELQKTKRNIYCIGRKSDVGLLSKYGYKYSLKSNKEIKHTINNILENLNEKPFLFITSEYFITLILQEFEELFEIVEVVGPDISTYKIFNDKNKTYDYLEKSGIAVPKSFHVNNDEDKISSLDFPLIMKWSKAYLEEDTKFDKTTIINNFEEMREVRNNIGKDREYLIFQTYLSEEKFDQISFGGYFEKGVPKMEILVNQIRQYPKGVSSFVEEITDPQLLKRIRNMAYSLLEPTNYTGFIELEFKIDKSHENIFLIDINPRTWGWVSILSKKYKDFSKVFYFEQGEAKKKLKRVQWVNPFRDIIVTLNLVKQKKSFIPLVKNFKSLLHSPTTYDLLSIKDIKPSIGVLIRGVRSFIQG